MQLRFDEKTIIRFSRFDRFWETVEKSLKLSKNRYLSKIKDQILKRMQKTNSIQMDKNASLQIDDFQEISIVYHYIKEFEWKF